MNPIKGTIAVIGNYGTGKTTFTLECGYQPKDITFINDDVKMVGIDGFKHYVDLVADSEGLKILELHQHCLELIDKLPESKVIIWDTWTRFQTTFPAYVKANPNQFRDAREYSAMGKIKSAEQYNDAYQYEGQILTRLRNKCELLILTFHTKQHYENNVAIVGKQAPGHDKAITKYSDLRIWLIANPNSSVPSGIVLKNIGKYTVTKDGIQTLQVLPQKLYECNWKSIKAYYDNPIGNRETDELERPNEFELSLIEGSLTVEEKRLYEVSARLVEQQNENEEMETIAAMNEQAKAIQARVKELNDSPLPIVFKTIKDEIESGSLTYDSEITMGQVANWMKG